MGQYLSLVNSVECFPV